jgi:3-mercaptopyruvate sulfurtransferase SseA
MDNVSKKKLLFELVAMVAFIFATLTACSPSPTQPQAKPTSPVAASPAEMQRVTLEESKAAFDSGAATFVDVRSQSSYAANHIPGALSIPLIELEGRIDELDPHQWIITYCT